MCFLDACLSPYSKLLLTSPAQVLNLVAEEKAVLQAQLSQEEDAQGCFIQSALCLLQVTKATCLSVGIDGAAVHSEQKNHRMK